MAAASPSLARQLGGLIVARLLIVVAVTLPYFVFLDWLAAKPLETPGFLYQLATQIYNDVDPDFLPRLLLATFFICAIYLVGLRWRRISLETQATIQFVGDLILVSALVYGFGGIQSPFAMLYLPVIVITLRLLRRQLATVLALVTFAAYAIVLLGVYFGWAWPPEAAVEEPGVIFVLLYRLIVAMVGFYAVALLVSYQTRDITRAERELKEKRVHLADLQVVHRDIIQSINSGLATTDLGGVVTSINRAGLDILKTSEEALLGRPIVESPLFTPKLWRRSCEECDRHGRMRSEVTLEEEGRKVFVGFSISRLNDAEGVHKGYIVIFQDFTQWRKLEEEVRLKDRMAAVGEMAAGIAHEVGNPLAAVSGSVQMLARTLSGDTYEQRLLEIILKESQRLDRTIKSFLRFARPKEPSIGHFDIARLLAENFELLRNSPEVSGGHHLELDLDPSSVSLMADADQMSQIFWNLARNALRAMPQGGTLHISGRLEGERYKIRFTDTGRGMSEAERARIFHPFHSFFDGGTGIGMAIVYRIIQEHRGNLSVDSRPGEGATICVELPLIQAERVPAMERRVL